MSVLFSPPYCEIDFPQTGERLRAAFCAPAQVLTAELPDEVPALLARVEALARSGYWAIGFVSYEAATAFDAALSTHHPATPLAMFAVYSNSAASSQARGDCLCGIWSDTTTRARFDSAVESIRSGIGEGRYYQVNYTTRLRAPFLGDSLAFFDRLRASQPGAYCAYLDFGRWQVCSASPELFFHWHRESGTLISRPMKGTAARGADPQSDRDAAAWLSGSAKDRAENLMIVDLIRSDMSRVAQLGSVRVPDLFSIESWPTVWQMTSTVECKTRRCTSLADVFGGLFPCGSVTGAPKAAAMAAIESLETAPRGVYCGAIGVVKPGGEAIFSVGIRTAVIDSEAGIADCGIGSGIVIDSTAECEYAEWQAKQVFLKRACPDYELLETLLLHRGRYWLRRGHMARLERSAEALGFSYDGKRIAVALDAAAHEHPIGQWRLRLRLSPDGSAKVEVFALEQAPSAAMVALAPTAVASGNPWLLHKTSRREIYESLVVGRPGLFDTLLYNECGEATEFTRGNLVVELDGRRVTPPLCCGLLPGVLRQALLSARRVEERVVTLEDLRRASAHWFANSVRGLVAVRLRA